MPIAFELLSYVIAPSIVPFVGVLLAASVILVLEIVLSLILGSGFSDVLDAMLDSHAMPDSALGNWLLIKELPMLMVLTSIMCGFSVTGLVIQGVSSLIFGGTAPLWTVVVASLAGGLYLANWLGRAVISLKIVHTTALAATDFIGQTAVLTSPYITKDYAGTAHFIDHHGADHYVMVMPKDPDVKILEGEKVFIFERISESHFHVIKA